MTQIKDARAAQLWCEVLLLGLEHRFKDPATIADAAVASFAGRFGDADLRAQIAENKAARNAND